MFILLTDKFNNYDALKDLGSYVTLWPEIEKLDFLQQEWVYLELKTQEGLSYYLPQNTFFVLPEVAQKKSFTFAQNSPTVGYIRNICYM